MKPPAAGSIRPASQGDLGWLIACDPYAGKSLARQKWLARAIVEGHVLLAEFRADVVGYVVLEYSFFGCGFISLVAVAPCARRNGHALPLLRAAELKCKKTKLFTSTNASNTSARALFLKAGFAASGKIENLDCRDAELIFYKSTAGAE
jgi:N-acetylglutamate synthase-like GNAT family acetyltransferase